MIERPASPTRLDWAHERSFRPPSLGRGLFFGKFPLKLPFFDGSRHSSGHSSCQTHTEKRLFRPAHGWRLGSRAPSLATINIFKPSNSSNLILKCLPHVNKHPIGRMPLYLLPISCLYMFLVCVFHIKIRWHFHGIPWLPRRLRPGELLVAWPSLTWPFSVGVGPDSR